MKEKPNDFHREGPSSLHVTEEMLFSLPKSIEIIPYGHVECVNSHFLPDNIFIRFGTKLFRQSWVFRWVRIAHRLWLICSWSVMKETSWCLFLKKSNLKVFAAFSSMSSYLDDLFNIDNKYFDVLTSQNYPSELQLNKVNSSETEASFLDLHLSNLGGFTYAKFMINAMVLILRLQIFITRKVMFLVEHPSVFISRN